MPLSLHDLKVMLSRYRRRRDNVLDRMVIRAAQNRRVPCGSQSLPRVSVRQDYRSWAMDWEQAILTEMAKHDPLH